jgi:hypothetical protein
MPYGTPADMKKHGDGPRMESAKQERKNLMDDNPVTRTAAGDRPWISKHYKSGMNYGTPMSMDTPMEKHDGKDFKDKGFMDSHFPSGKPRGGDALKMDHK